jgi:hypothetical protein
VQRKFFFFSDAKIRRRYDLGITTGQKREYFMFVIAQFWITIAPSAG